MKTHFNRLIEPYLIKLLDDFPAVAIDGLKGVGKTFTAKKIASTVFELDKPKDYDQIANIPDILISEPPPVLIDEWQRIPSIWDFVRRAVDDGVKPGAFLLTGSISNADINIHSGAARIIKRKMHPLSLAERGIEKPTVSVAKLLSADKPFSADISGKTDIGSMDYIYEISASGLPEFRKYNAENRKIAFESFFSNILSHDFRQQGIRLRQPEILLRWLRAYAAAVSTDAGYAEILDASTAGESNKPSVKTTIAYREALENLWLLDELMPWLEGENFFAGLKLSPKHYLADPAIAAYLLGLDEKILAGGNGWPSRAERFDAKYGSVIGRLFEALIQLSLNVYTSVNNAKLYFVKTHKGDREVDFVIQKDSKILAFEVKFSPAAAQDDGRHLKWFMDKVGGDCRDALIITTGSVAYRRKDGVAVVPAALLGA